MIRRVISIIAIIVGYILGVCTGGGLLINSVTEFFITLYNGRMNFSMLGWTAIKCILSYAILAIFTYSGCAIAAIIDSERKCKNK